MGWLSLVVAEGAGTTEAMRLGTVPTFTLIIKDRRLTVEPLVYAVRNTRYRYMSPDS